ncbi:MAG: hypothetical protein EPO13_04515 [Actinomycetota bacterium]|nr:MAG: hypothetical protein EPO13_04515 [Actinomycetota bacterium]
MNDVPDNDALDTVRTLLASAGLSPSPQEQAALAAGYPAFRAMVDRLYDAPLPREDDPLTVFTPADPPPVAG